MTTPVISTGRRSPLDGLYQSCCACAETLELGMASPLPQCPSCGQAVRWRFLQPRARGLVLVTPEETRQVETHVARLRASLEHEPNPTLSYALGRSLLRLGQVEPAVGVLLDGTARGAVPIAGHLEVARTLVAMRRPAAALEVLGRARELAEKDDDLEAVVQIEPLAEIARTFAVPRTGRKAERVPLESVFSRSDGLAPGRYSAVNISETGACVSSSKPASPGEFVALSFAVANRTLRSHAQVVWCRQLGCEGDPYSVGLQFLGSARQVTEQIREYVAAGEQSESSGAGRCRSRSRRS